jgi:hypothetical protein
MPKKKLPDLDRIKFRAIQAQDGSPCIGKWRYGTFEKWGADTEKHWPKDYVVADAISGERFLVANDGSWEVVGIPRGPMRDFSRNDDSRVSFYDDEYGDFIDKEWQKAQEKSKKAKGCSAGKLFKIGVADGYAYYVVTRGGKRNVSVEWRNFGGDSYYDQILGGGGSFPRHCIEPLVEREEAFAKIFSKKK